MNDELPKSTSSSTPQRPLDERLAHRPAVLARLHELADTLEQSVGDDCTADQAEDRVTEHVRRLAREVLEQWAQEAHAHTQAAVSTRHPAAIRHGKKKTDLADDFRLGGGGGGAMAAGAARSAVAALL